MGGPQFVVPTPQPPPICDDGERCNVQLQAVQGMAGGTVREHYTDEGCTACMGMPSHGSASI